ncbi:Crp/Fnr family transcriptional regulator [Ferrimonas lipolytica]|uniref:Crp/Fnr family transcriptional regulator n=1 Tax=Ferrimonas lipolytica TaxID=2724191 RepID=A0A6H1UB65_9GAMM|nr:Crp/Fnr family transcriptional regulator [Ferrimonas lipolytica]QIZ76305.1 Crp/Fnr family transcriptional regulator [Ferrimonas lipolytica]
MSEFKGESDFDKISHAFENDFESFLRKSNLNDDAIASVLDCCIVRELDKGETFTADYEMSAVNFLCSGFLKSLLEIPVGTLRCAGFAAAGYCFHGDPPGGRQVTNYIALRQSRVISIRGEDLQRLAKEFSSIFELTIKVYTYKLYAERNWLVLGSAIDKKQYVLTTLYLLSIYQLKSGEEVTIRQQDVAEYCGVTQTYANLVINEAVKTGAIKKKYGGIEVLSFELFTDLVDLDLIENMAEQDPQMP